ncbi:MAG: hypothetical protein WAO61_05785 [Solirubrobacterales bacterium]
MRNKPTLAVAIIAALVLTSGAAAATKLTSRNSVSYALMNNTTEQLTGVNCGATATFTRTLPEGSAAIKIVKPVIGELDGTGKGTRVTAVSVAGTVVSFTVVADGPNVCDPALTGYPPGDDVPWQAVYDFRAEYTRRIQTTMRVFYESYTHGAKWKTRPKTIQDSRKGTPRRARQRVTGIKWKSFGGRKAVGYGKLREDFCRSGDNCPNNGKRVRLVAGKPGYCKDSNRFEYLRLTVYRGKTALSDANIVCSP